MRVLGNEFATGGFRKAFSRIENETTLFVGFWCKRLDVDEPVFARMQRAEESSVVCSSLPHTKSGQATPFNV